MYCRPKPPKTEGTALARLQRRGVNRAEGVNRERCAQREGGREGEGEGRVSRASGARLGARGPRRRARRAAVAEVRGHDHGVPRPLQNPKASTSFRKRPPSSESEHLPRGRYWLTYAPERVHYVNIGRYAVREPFTPFFTPSIHALHSQLHSHRLLAARPALRGADGRGRRESGGAPRHLPPARQLLAAGALAQAGRLRVRPRDDAGERHTILPWAPAQRLRPQSITGRPIAVQEAPPPYDHKRCQRDTSRGLATALRHDERGGPPTEGEAEGAAPASAGTAERGT